MSRSSSRASGTDSVMSQTGDVDDPDPIDTAAIGLLPSRRKFEAIFTRITAQLDFLNRTTKMMVARLDYLEDDVAELRQSNERS
jgi:hypothetical protein